MSTRCQMLIVDDDAPVAASLRRLFRRASFETKVAYGGREALRLLGEFEPDVVVTDQRMPDVSGAEVLAEVRRRFPRAVRVLVSGYAAAEAQLNALQQDQDCLFVAKPWDDATLLREIRRRLQAVPPAGEEEARDSQE